MNFKYISVAIRLFNPVGYKWVHTVYEFIFVNPYVQIIPSILLNIMRLSIIPNCLQNYNVKF